MSAITELLKQNSWWIVNKNIAKSVGVESALLLSYLASKNDYFKEQSKIFQGQEWFFNTSEAIESETGLSYRVQKKCIGILEKSGLIKTKLMGLPRKLYFTLCEDNICEFVKPIIAENATIQLAKTQNTYKEFNNKDSKIKIQDITSDESLEAVAKIDLLPELTSKRKKVAPKKEKVSYRDFIDLWRTVETDKFDRFNFSINDKQNVGQFKNILKVLSKDLDIKYGNYTEQKLKESLEIILNLAYKYFSEMYENKVTAVFLFDPAYVYRHYQKIKTYRPGRVKTKNKDIDWNEMNDTINQRFKN
ncbi:MAG: hypothetical protein E6Q39_00080 [Crocinitomicaceae bacterium]|nr:MAG: hypothetical protein E6Q39_00080 [Crocinitomicaceae bacterium]